MWQEIGNKQSQSMNPVRPRVSLIGAVSTNGEVFLSLCQANTDSEIMKLFSLELIQTLDARDKSWKQHDCWIMDQAGY